VPELEINILESEIEQRKERWQQRDHFGKPDRVPVLAGIGTRYWLPIIGLSFLEYFSSPRVMFKAQLKAMKWLFEHLRDDRFQFAVFPDFQNVREASGLGCKVVFREGFPWIEKPIIKDESDIIRIKKADMTRQGLTAKMIYFYREMKRMAKGYRIITQGGSHELEVWPGMGTDGPFTNVAWIRGPTQLLRDVMKRPEFVHELMDIVTEKIIEFNMTLRELACLPDDCGIGIADDFAAYLSPDHYREFVLPYHERIYKAFKTKHRSIHLCGKIDHLLEILVKEERISRLDGFGWVTNPRKLAEVMGGKVLLYGGPSPMLIKQGPRDRIMAECRRYLEIFKPLRGYALGDGYNIPPGTPPENINAMVEAAEIYGRYE